MSSTFENIINFNAIHDSRGYLVPIEGGKNLPFEIKRIYYVRGCDKKSRGYHAHRTNQQVLVCLQGSLDMIFEDLSGVKTTYKMESPTKGIFIDRWIWHEMHNITSDCIMLVMCSEQYDENEYIRNYLDFKALAKEQ